MRICSFLPSATEMVYALGAGEMLTGVSHECDYPAEAQRKPIVSRARFDHTQLDSAAINQLVAQTLQRGESLYAVDREVLRQANPDLILTQELCDVCAVTGNDLAGALRDLDLAPDILTLSPTNLAGIYANIRVVGAAIGVRERADRLVAELTERVARVAERAQSAAQHPRVFCLEWLDPPYDAGHWVPELVHLAGGTEVVGRAGQPSRRVEWSAIADAQPDVVIVTSCGFGVARTLQELPRLQARPEWRALPAVRAGRVFVTDGAAYFSRPGPRIVDGLEILAHALHPALFPQRYPAAVFQEAA